jgi:hypothetical protein
MSVRGDRVWVVLESRREGEREGWISWVCICEEKGGLSTRLKLLKEKPARRKKKKPRRNARETDEGEKKSIVAYGVNVLEVFSFRSYYFFFFFCSYLISFLLPSSSFFLVVAARDWPGSAMLAPAAFMSVSPILLSFFSF